MSRHRGSISRVVLFFAQIGFGAALMMCLSRPAHAAQPVKDLPYHDMRPQRFDVHHSELDAQPAPTIEPWKTVVLDPQYRGSWVITGDLTRDGRREIVCARSVGSGSDRYTSAAAAHTLDGAVLWRWGDPSVGTGKTGFDLACQIHDFDGDGDNEVVLSADRAVVVLDGKTGEELRRITIPPRASDCIVFCNLSGGDNASDFLVKDRYEQIWAYSREGRLLWTQKHPGGYLTAHQPRPMDIDGDGRDEIMAGFVMLNSNGSLRWVLDETVPYCAGPEQQYGHLDCARILQHGNSPQDMRLIATFCGGSRIAKVDGNGRFLWRVGGAHFESVQIGKIMPDVPGKQILVDIDHQPFGRNPLVVFSQDGELLGRFMLNRSRHHLLLDWNGDGVDSIVAAQAAAILNGRGEVTARLGLPTPRNEESIDPSQLTCQTADMTGDGTPDLILSDNPGTRVYIYENRNGQTRNGYAGTGSDNFTYY